MAKVTYILLLAILIYSGIGFYLYLTQRSLLYFPVAATASGLAEQIFNHNGYTIKASILNPDNNKAIIYFGGNAENVDDNGASFAQLFPQHTVYLVKYRGYAGSTGSPSEQAFYADALHIYDVISKTHPDISLIGRSLGSGVATYLATARDISKLVLITPFDSIERVAQSRFPLYPMRILLKDKYDSFSRAKDINAATLILTAEHDNIIKMRHSKRLLSGFNTKVQFYMINNVNHNTIASHPDYYHLLANFLNTGNHASGFSQ